MGVVGCSDAVGGTVGEHLVSAISPVAEWRNGYLARLISLRSGFDSRLRYPGDKPCR